ncbi:MAG: excinuclease ABC subunit A [Chloroflexi bacterium]|nr:excinuclease ABC subunit A [Chloroflexota bacterium]
MESKKIIIKGAREHNLKNIDVEIPKNQLVVITGVSGSGKSSLAFDTIFAEGQRRYVESLSAYARQFLGRLEKPDVDRIEGLSPAISIDQKGVSKNPRSTVGTVTEIFDYFRLLYSRIGKAHCPKCGEQVSKQSAEEIANSILNFPDNSKISILAPLVTHMKGEHKSLFDDLRKKGFIRVQVDGKIVELDSKIELNKNKWHTIEAVIDRLIIKNNIDKSRLFNSIETSLKIGKGSLICQLQENKQKRFSENLSCSNCKISLTELEPRNFSFNTPYGACKSCSGLGFNLQADPYLIIPNQNKTLSEGAIEPWTLKDGSLSWEYNFIKSLSHTYNFSLELPLKQLKPEIISKILYGTKNETLPITYLSKKGNERIWHTTFDGVVHILEKRYQNTDSDSVRDFLSNYMVQKKCESCSGQRLNQESLNVTILDLNIMEVSSLSVSKCLEWLKSCSSNNNKHLTNSEKSIGSQIFKELKARLTFLTKVGLDYLSINRSTSTLSGGESQRIRLATQIGSGLTGVLYVCDEPSIGLHPVDNHLLISTLLELRDLGNTILIVEHDESIMRASDNIIDLGIGAGNKGGELIAQGKPNKIESSKKSLTGQYLSGKKKIVFPLKRREGSKQNLIIKGARENNLSNIDVNIPLGKIVCVSGVSGSGKSTLVNEIIYKNISKILYKTREIPGECDEILGIENIDKVINIDQTPIGRTPRSNPATYTGVFTSIRELFASVPESRSRGYKAGRFSFNVKGGRCESCSGAGYTEIQMQFLPDVTVPCELCRGKRYNKEALEIKFKNLNISEILDLTVSEAYELFFNIPNIKNKLKTLIDVGLGYIKLGQPATTLSGGEAQRIKLSSQLSKKSTGKTFYILDEPTTGLSFEDCNNLVKILHKLADSGNTILLIEHHLDLIKNADWIIDLGPGAGSKGGKIVAEGTPENIITKSASFTGKYLKSISEIKPKKALVKKVNLSNKSSKNKNSNSNNSFIFPIRPETKNIIRKRSRRFRRKIKI